MVPMIELRRLLNEARDARESFALVLRKEAATGWRRLRVFHRAGDASRLPRTSCKALGRLWSACTEVEHLLFSTAPPAWAMRSLLFFPFPMQLTAYTNASTPELGCLA